MESQQGVDSLQFGFVPIPAELFDEEGGKVGGATSV